VRESDRFGFRQFKEPAKMKGVRLPRLCYEPVIRFQTERNITPDPHRLDKGPFVAKAEQHALAA
jgi:hypothetical protein